MRGTGRKSTQTSVGQIWRGNTVDAQEVALRPLSTPTLDAYPQADASDLFAPLDGRFARRAPPAKRVRIALGLKPIAPAPFEDAADQRFWLSDWIRTIFGGSRRSAKRLTYMPVEQSTDQRDGGPQLDAGGGER